MNGQNVLVNEKRDKHQPRLDHYDRKKYDEVVIEKKCKNYSIEIYRNAIFFPELDGKRYVLKLYLNLGEILK